MTRKRERYLDDFLKKMAQREYLFYSDEFQTFLRDQWNDTQPVRLRVGPDMILMMMRNCDVFDPLLPDKLPYVEFGAGKPCIHKEVVDRKGMDKKHGLSQKRL